jgi:tRNA-2-methylthio-N6-dimethylallyladenosine synthase
MAEAFRRLPTLCPYLHLPVQSGSDRVLADMRRGYTRARYLETVDLLRGRRPDLALTSDVIVGYPGESEDDFADTVSLVEEVGFDGLFVFLYSPRPGTSALRLGDPVPEEEKKRRFQVLNEQQQRRQAGRNQCRVGTSEEVLLDAVTGPGRPRAAPATSASCTSTAPRPGSGVPLTWRSRAPAPTRCWAGPPVP